MDIYEQMKHDHDHIKETLKSIVDKSTKEAILRPDGVKVLSTLLRYLKGLKDDIELNLEDEESMIFEIVDESADVIPASEL